MTSNHDDTPEPPADDGDFGGIEIPDEHFRVEDEGSANWVVRKVVEVRAYAERVKRWAEQELHRAEADEQRLLYLYEGQLRAWVSEQIAQRGGRRKSLDLPAGRVGYRRLGATLVVDDADAVLRWARAACPEAVVVSERLDKIALNAHLEKSGELPEKGAHVEPERDRFFIK